MFFHYLQRGRLGWVRGLGWVSPLVLLSVLSLWGHLDCGGATVWTGPNVTWTKSTTTPSDTIIAGKVVLTRGSRDVLYNIAAGETSAGLFSPKDTLWAFGDISSFDRLTYQTMESLRNGNLAARILNQPMVVHLTNEDIYLSIRITTWGQNLSGTVSYTRSTPSSGGTPPTVNIANPATGSVFAAPASVAITANATVSGGTVTNVAFFNNTTFLGNAGATPFNSVANDLGPGAYSLTAVATAGGISATSTAVNITVVTPAAVALTPPRINGGFLSFNYSADRGLKYVVQGSPDLSAWVPLVTNIAAETSVPFSENSSAVPTRFYRVERVPNP